MKTFRLLSLTAGLTLAILSSALAADADIAADPATDSTVQHVVVSKRPSGRRRARDLTVSKEYLLIPIHNGAEKTEVRLEVEGTPVRRYDTELATSADSVDWYSYFHIASYNGKAARVVVDRASDEGFALIRQATQVPGAASRYAEALRPQFHFSQEVGWNNDPNGMVYLDGEWHLFFQHNPVGWNWGNMTWGHAVSKDLVHWRQLPDALFPKTMAAEFCFSGSATTDARNTAGWQTGNRDVLVAFLTDTGAGESAAYSNDRGRSFTWYPGNPVVKHRGRDPKVIWYPYDADDRPLSDHAKAWGGHWVMAVYDEHEKCGQNIAFYTSENLKDWEEQSHLPGYFECPEIFALPVDGHASDTRWVVFAGDARYAIGDFDGRRFTPQQPGKYQVHYGPYYASQTFANAPQGRRIQIGWVQIDAPGMPFNQMFSFPYELTLRSTDEGVRMFAKPVAEIEKIHKQKYEVKPQDLTSGSPVVLKAAGELFDVRATFELGKASRVGLDIGGNRIAYDVATGRLGDVPMKPVDGRISLQVLMDRPMIEICGNDGAVAITAPRDHRGDVRTIEAFAMGEGARLVHLEAYELASIWSDQTSAEQHDKL